jgi:DNA primase small subunit
METCELAFETVDQVFIRWQSAATPTALKALIASKRVSVLHVGATYNMSPAFKSKMRHALAPIRRPLVFDIDLTDYPMLGVEKSDMEGCDRAWPFVAFALLVIESLLRKHLGFERTMFTYSGRRGAHVTVFDERACSLSDEGRAAIVGYLQPSWKTTENGRILAGNLLTAFDDLWEEKLLPFWENVCVKARTEGGLGVLDTAADQDDFLELMGRKHSRDLLVRAGNGTDAWESIKRSVSDSAFPKEDFKALQECVLTHVYPRLDVNVSKQTGHLAKAPFSIHAKTGRICVPLSSDPSTFDPLSAPTVAELTARNPKAVKAMAQAVRRAEHFATRLGSIGENPSW